LHAAIEKVLPIMLRIVVNLWNEKLDELRDSTFSITHDVDSMNKKIEEMQNRFGAIVKSAEKKVKCIDENCNEALWRVETDNSVGVAGGPGRSKDNSITDKALMRGSTGATFYAHSDDSAIIQVSKDTAPELHLRIYDSFDGYVPSDYFNQVGAELVWGDKDKKENSWALGGYHRMMIRDTYSYAYPGIQGGGFSGGYAYNAEKWMTALKSTIEYGALDFGGFGNHKVPYTQFMVSGLFGGKVADNHLLYGKLQYNMQKVTVTDSWEDVQDGQTTTGSTETNIFQHRVNWSANYVYFAPRGEIKVGAGWSHSIPGPDAFLFNVGFSSRRDDPGYAWNLDFGGGPSTRFADSLQLAPYTYNVGFGMDFPIASATSKRSRLTLGFGLGIDFDKPTPTSSWADTGMTIFGLFRIHYDVSNKTLPSNY
jgi:hypothetical protein